MGSDFATDELMIKRDELIAERDRLAEGYNQRIASIENAIETLAGKRIWEYSQEEKFDDLNRNYIKGSFEEM